MKKYHSINELCRLTKVSVRTLHHYDEINLLKPNHRTEKGHRRYSEEDLFSLQQIVILKFMGSSLSEIKDILKQKKFNFFDSLKIQENALLEKISFIQKIAKLIHYLMIQHELNQPVNWTIVIKIIEVLKTNSIEHQRWHENYLTDAEQELFNRYGFTRQLEWQALFSEARDNLNAEPNDERDIEFVNKLLAKANETYGSAPDLVNKLWEAFKAGIIPDQLSNDKEIIAYITTSFEKLLRRNE